MNENACGILLRTWEASNCSEYSCLSECKNAELKEKWQLYVAQRQFCQQEATLSRVLPCYVWSKRLTPHLHSMPMAKEVGYEQYVCYQTLSNVV